MGGRGARSSIGNITSSVNRYYEMGKKRPNADTRWLLNWTKDRPYAKKRGYNLRSGQSSVISEKMKKAKTKKEGYELAIKEYEKDFKKAKSDIFKINIANQIKALQGKIKEQGL